MDKEPVIPEERVISKIYAIRDKKVMLDKDLAELYGVTTGNLNKAVGRNIKRFPGDFMFQVTKEEWENLKPQTGTPGWGGTRKMPRAFTEQGVAMLSGVLGSDRAIMVNIQIMRAYTRMREMLLTHRDLLLKMEQLERKILGQDERAHKHEEEIQLIFNALKQLLNPPAGSREPVGFKTKK